MSTLPEHDTTAETLDLVVFVAGGWRVGIEARHVVAATPIAAEQAAGGALNDLTTRLGLTPPGDCLIRQCLEINQPTGSQKILVDGPLELRSLACDGIRPLPPLFAARNTLKGLRALVLPSQGNGMILLLDIHALLSIEAQRHEEESP